MNKEILEFKISKLKTILLEHPEKEEKIQAKIEELEKELVHLMLLEKS